MYFKSDFIQIQIGLFNQITVSISDNWNTKSLRPYYAHITSRNDYRNEWANAFPSHPRWIRPSVCLFLFPFMNKRILRTFAFKMCVNNEGKMCLFTRIRHAWWYQPSTHWRNASWLDEAVLIGLSTVGCLVRLICLHSMLHRNFIASIDRSVKVNLTVT